MNSIVNHNIPKACIIASVSSGCGKTTLSLGIMRALARKGYSVCPFKAGPDYLDGTYHALATTKPSYNLDTWMIDKSALTNHFRSCIAGHDIGIVEGAMGLYDGFEGTMEGSSADLARILGIPVILLVDCKGMSGSVAPLVSGFKNFHPDVHVACVILNRTGSERHVRYLKEALKKVDITVAGYFPRNDELTLEHRHLGLFAAQFGGITEKKIDMIADTVTKTINLDLLVELCSSVNVNTLPNKNNKSANKKVCRIAVARDKAFHFYYQANLDMLENSGAELVFFSPLEDSVIPNGIDGLLLGGGYPEIYAAELAKNETMRMSIRRFSLDNGCIYAECGGYMYLGDHLEKDGISFPMCGVFSDGFCIKSGTRKSLGYRETKLAFDTIIGQAGTIVRGHEFHYSFQKHEIYNTEQAPFIVSTRDGASPVQNGMSIRNTTGSYMHLHFLSCPSIPDHFVDSCRKYAHLQEINRCLP